MGKRTTKLRAVLAPWLPTIEACAPCISATVIAVTCVIGLAYLCAEYISGGVAARQVTLDHATAIGALFFRR